MCCYLERHINDRGVSIGGRRKEGGGGRLCPTHYCQPPRNQKAICTSVIGIQMQIHCFGSVVLGVKIGVMTALKISLEFIKQAKKFCIKIYSEHYCSKACATPILVMGFLMITISRVMRVGSNTFGNPIFQKSLQYQPSSQIISVLG